MVAALLVAPCVLRAQMLAPGDTLHIRLLDRLDTHHRQLPVAIRAVVIAPVTRDGRVIVPPGSVIDGWVTGAGKESFEGKRHWVDVRFDTISISPGGARGDMLHVPSAMRILGVDDSREGVDTSGRIVGPPIPSLVHSKRDWAVLLLGIFHPVGAIVLAATLEGEIAERHRAISLNAGTEMTAMITRGVTLGAWPQWAPPPPITSGLNVDSLAASVPLRATLRDGRAPSDVIALAVIGSVSQVHAALTAAGWTRAVPLTLRSDFATFVKAAKGKGYEAQPVSELVLDGRPPDIVYEKVADTFVKRHHFRMWRWPSTAPSDSSSTMWLIAATHDTGVMFSTQRRSFTHRVDPHIDEERDKIVSDLVAANEVAALSYASRAVPPNGATVNGGRVPAVTDWRIAVLVLR